MVSAKILQKLEQRMVHVNNALVGQNCVKTLMRGSITGSISVVYAAV